jgi:hypothetical protein
MRILLIIAAIAIAGVARAQPPVCAAAPAVGSIPWDAVRLSWDAVTTWAPPAPTPLPAGWPNIPTPTNITYIVYERVGVNDTAVCTTTGLAAGVLNLAAGVHSWLVTARTPRSTPPNIESIKAGPVTKDNVQPVIPSTPGNIAVQ